jgi:hypothetical protein
LVTAQIVFPSRDCKERLEWLFRDGP